MYLIDSSSECCNYLDSTDALMILKSIPYQCAFFTTLFSFIFCKLYSVCMVLCLFYNFAGTLILWCLHCPGKVISWSYTNVLPVLLNHVAVFSAVTSNAFFGVHSGIRVRNSCKHALFFKESVTFWKILYFYHICTLNKVWSFLQLLENNYGASTMLPRGTTEPRICPTW